MLDEMCPNAPVAFSPQKEDSMANIFYKALGASYIIGRVQRILNKSKKNNALFQVCWLDTQYQKLDETVNLVTLQRGMRNYAKV